MRLLTSGIGRLLREQGVMLGLIALMTLLFAAQWWIPWPWYDPLMATPAEVVASWDRLRSGNFNVDDLGEFGTLISHAFLHADLGHLLGNLVFYWIFGALINELLGWKWLLGLVVFTAAGGGITHVIMHHDEMNPLLGASGVVAGFMGAYLGLAVRWSLPDPHIWPMARPIPPSRLAILAIIFIALDYRELFGGPVDMIAYGAHAGGFTAGLFLTSFITPMPRQAQPA